MPGGFLYKYVREDDPSIIKSTYRGDYSYHIAPIGKNGQKKYMSVDLYDKYKFPVIPKDVYYLDINFFEEAKEYPKIPDHVRSLTLINNRISKFPKDLPKNLLRLSFINCINIQEIPDIRYLEKLRYLSFFRSYQMKDINSKHLPKKLERLRIVAASLKNFPDKLPLSLKQINFSFGDIETLPNVNYLPKLEKFIISNNPIKRYPKEPPRKSIYIELVNPKYPTLEHYPVYPPPGFLPSKLKKAYDKAYAYETNPVVLENLRLNKITR